MKFRVSVAGLYECPWCSYIGCLLGLSSHALAKHKKNLLAYACKAAPPHKHRTSQGTAVRYVIMPSRGASRRRRSPRRR